MINYVLIFGHFGAPEMGVTGAAIGTLIARMLETLVLILYIVNHNSHLKISLHEISPNIVLFSEISWNKLKPEEQKVIKEAFDESVTYFNDLSDKSDAETLNKMKEKGVQIIEPSNPQEWRDAVKGIYTKYASEYQSTIDAIRAVKY